MRLTYGETANTPTAVAKYGTIKHTYSNTADGTYTEEVLTNAGTYYVKANIEETADYSGDLKAMQLNLQYCRKQ